MASASDVAVYILREHGPMSAMKLQKLVYYSQAWHATWDGEQLFPQRIEAWANGPVVRELYDQHKGLFNVNPSTFTGDPGQLTDSQMDSIDTVCESYGNKTAQWLSDMTHSEPPWQNARRGLAHHERSTAPISLGDMVEYYSTLTG